MKRTLIGIAAILALAVLVLLATGNGYILRGIKSTYLIGKSKPDIDDMGYFDVSTISADHPEPWPIHHAYNLGNIPAEWQASVDSMETTALLVIRQDSILLEKYWDGFDEHTRANSFSMAKSFTAMMIGKAIDEGYIRSVDQRVGDFIPEFNEGKASTLTIKHLLEMSSGIPFGESYASPFGYMAKAYFGKDLISETMKFKVEKDPGSLWIYEGGNTVLLGMILKAATGRTPSEYFFQKIWSCVGAEDAAYWNLDREGGMEKTFSGFYATARDFARIGKLYLHHGVWENDTVINPAFVEQSITPNMVRDSTGEACDWYGLHWWLGEHNGQKFFSCRGLRGQYIAVIPEAELIVVRLGHQQRKDRTDHMPPDLYMYLDIARSVAAQAN